MSAWRLPHYDHLLHEYNVLIPNAYRKRMRKNTRRRMVRARGGYNQ